MRHIFKITAGIFKIFLQLVLVYIEIVVVGDDMQNFVGTWDSLDFDLCNVDSFAVGDGFADKILADIAFVD